MDSTFDFALQALASVRAAEAVDRRRASSEDMKQPATASESARDEARKASAALRALKDSFWARPVASSGSFVRA